jgi:hypothetical protein
MDGARGLGLLDDSFEEGSDAGKQKAHRRQSNYSNGSSAVTEQDRVGRGGGNVDEEYDRGATYLRSWLFTVRRVLTTYYFVTSFVLIFFFALKVSVFACVCHTDPVDDVVLRDRLWPDTDVFGARVHGCDPVVASCDHRQCVQSHVFVFLVPDGHCCNGHIELGNVGTHAPILFAMFIALHRCLGAAHQLLVRTGAAGVEAV